MSATNSIKEFIFIYKYSEQMCIFLNYVKENIICRKILFPKINSNSQSMSPEEYMKSQGNS